MPKSKINWKLAEQFIAEHTKVILSPKLANRPLVSVCFITYNHVDFVEEALDSVLMQETDFRVEIIIGDDASTDGTSEVVDRYQQANPYKIKILRSTENLGKYTGNGRLNFIRNLRACRGKFIAPLEADDYWTDPYKLQKQVNYLEANPGVSCCATRFNEIDNGTIKKTLFPNHKNIIKHDLESVLNSNWSPIQTLTMVFRSDILKPKLHLLTNKKIYAGDYSITVLLALKGEIHVLSDNTGNKRVDSGGVWESLHDILKCRKLIETMDETAKLIPFEYKKLVANRINHHADYLLQNVATNGRDLFKTTIFLLRLHTRNRHITFLCLKYIINLTKIKLGRLKPQL